MIAVIKTGGKQYAVKAGQILKVEKIEGMKGDSVSFDNVLALTDSSSHTIGNPLIKDAFVEAKILDQIRDKKIIVFKKRKRKNYRLTQGHRQYLTVLQIESIIQGRKKYFAPKKELKPKQIEDKPKTSTKEVSAKVVKKKTIKKATTIKKTVKKIVKVKK